MPSEFDYVEAPTEGKVDKWGFTIKPPMCDNEVIIRCLKNAPCFGGLLQYQLSLGNCMSALDIVFCITICNNYWIMLRVFFFVRMNLTTYDSI